MLLEEQKKLGSKTGSDSGSSPVRMMDVEAPKLNIIGKSIRESSKNKENNHRGDKSIRLIRKL